MRDRMEKVSGEVRSRIGFYVGDPAYALSDEIYHETWGKSGYAAGRIETEERIGGGESAAFVVARTKYGDGEYEDYYEENRFPVDSGTIAVIPMELVTKTSPEVIRERGLGMIIEKSGKCKMTAKDGRFSFHFKYGWLEEMYYIDTHYEADGENEDADDEDLKFLDLDTIWDECA